MPRTMDERPVPGDKGMDDRPRPPMNQLGVYVRRQMLDQHHMPYRANFQNDTLTLLSARDFLQFMRLYGEMSKKTRIPLVRGEESLTMTLTSGKDSIDVRLAGDTVKVLLTECRSSFGSAAGEFWFDTASPVNLQAVLRTLASLDAELT